MNQLSVLKTITQGQYGAVARHQLIEQGLSSSSISRMLKKGLISKVGNGVYLSLGSTPTWHQRAAIAVLSCGPSALLSHESVLIYFGLLTMRQTDHKKVDPLLIHVTAPRNEFHFQDVVFHRSKCLPPEDVYRPSMGVPHVSLGRAFIDCTSQLSESQLDFSLEKAFTKKLITPLEIQSTLIRTPRGPGRQKSKLRRILTPYLLDGTTLKNVESELEKRVQKVINKYTNIKCIPQHPVKLNGSMFRLDFAIPEQKIAIEVDGYEFHRGRSQFDNDRIRQNALISDGWKIVRITATFTNLQITNAINSVMAG